MLNYAVQENDTTPRGPNEVGETWRATARLGYSVHSTLLWSAAHPLPGTVITITTRVMEKTALSTVHVLEQVMRRATELGLLNEAITDVCMWSDPGPHYRANRVLAACCVRWPVIFKRDSHLRYGLEHHTKEDMDRFLSILDRRLCDWEKSAWLKTTSDLCVCWEAGASARQQPKPHEVFIDFVPTVHRTEFDALLPFLRRESLPATMRGTHAWTFKAMDKRRKSMIGRGGITVTGVSTRSETLPGFQNLCRDGFSKVTFVAEASTGLASAEESGGEEAN